MTESEWRDRIAGDIGKLKPGLLLLQKERFIPNSHGTRSFIDLYAKDEQGRHVLIELKRSGAAARQAIHEVNKYVEGVKGYFGAKDTEIHVIIASTEWDELIVPFSRFAHDAGFSIEGLRIVAGEGEDWQVEPVAPLGVAQGRLLAPWHNMYWYRSLEEREEGIRSIEEAYGQKGVADYVIVEMEAKDPAANNLFHKYILYTGMQQLTREECQHLLAQDPLLWDEVQKTLPSLEENEGEGAVLCYLHENIELLKPPTKQDYYEIGYPAKFSKLMESGDFTVTRVIRHGKFERNELLDDAVILAELKGLDGTTGQTFKRSVAMDNGAHVKTLRKDIDAALEENPVWRHHILHILDEIQREFPAATIDVWIFNPCTGIFSIYWALTREQGIVYLPYYHILVKNPQEERLYFGALQAAGQALSFKKILKKYYNTKLEALLFSLTWGGRDSRDSDIIEDMGAQYRSFRVDNVGEAREFSVLRDEKWRTIEPCGPSELFVDYVKQNRVLVTQLLRKIQSISQGAVLTINDAGKRLKKYVDMKRAKAKNVIYVGAPALCDLCGCPLEDETYMVDGPVVEGGPWACMCADCFAEAGGKIGWGHGQLYRRSDKGWLLVGGFPPEEEWE